MKHVVFFIALSIVFVLFVAIQFIASLWTWNFKPIKAMSKEYGEGACIAYKSLKKAF